MREKLNSQFRGRLYSEPVPSATVSISESPLFNNIRCSFQVQRCVDIEKEF